MPVEVQHPIPFAEDFEHASYDRQAAHRFWRVLMHADKIFQQFSSRFVGKVSPVHFFWGSFDLAVTRFSGRPAPPREGADAITREAYSHEVISAGFWPGNGGFGEAAFLLLCRAGAKGPRGRIDQACQGRLQQYARVSSSIFMRICARSLRRTRPCSPSSKAPTKQEPRLQVGSSALERS